MTMKFTMKNFQLVSKYANYLTWDEKQKFLGVQIRKGLHSFYF